MKKYAYQSPDDYRPENSFDIRQASQKPYMGITAFLRPNEPWLIVGLEKNSYVLENRNADRVKIDKNLPFNWVEATEKSRLVAAARSEGSPIPGTPHYSFEEQDWYLRIEDNILDPNDLLHEASSFEEEGESEGSDEQAENAHQVLEALADELGVSLEELLRMIRDDLLADSSDVVTGEPLDIGDEDIPFEREGTVKEATMPPVADPNQVPPAPPQAPQAPQVPEPPQIPQDPSQGMPVDPVADPTSDTKNLEQLLQQLIGEQGASPLAENPLTQNVAHKTQEGDDRKDEKAEPLKCPECGSHTTGNRLAEIGDDGSARVHCKTCGHVWSPKDLKINPKAKVAYEVDNGQRDQGRPTYGPGPDDPDKVSPCPNCGYSWGEHHKWQTGDKTCPKCGHEFGGADRKQNAGAPGDSWRAEAAKNPQELNLSGIPKEKMQIVKGLLHSIIDQSNTAEQLEEGMADLRMVLRKLQELHPSDGDANGEPLPIQEDNPEGVGVHQDTDYGKSIPEGESNNDFPVMGNVKESRRIFTPAEQKSLIEENMGAKARNSSKLNLENTHYLNSVSNDDDAETWLW